MDDLKALKERAEREVSKIIRELQLMDRMYGIEGIENALGDLQSVRNSLLIDLEELNKPE